MTPVVYISGRLRDPRGTYYVEKNIRFAEKVAVSLWKAGFAVICPHTNTRQMDGPLSHEDFLRGDLAIMARCDACVLLPNWSTSEGASEERKKAIYKGVPIYYWPQGIADLDRHFMGREVSRTIEEEV